MKLSIITINYNNLEGLRRTIDSVLTQTWRDFEWIIIDGGSSDGSKELIEQVAARHEANIAYWCSEPDKGIYNAMNKGIAKANGDYYLFLNSGDYFFDKEVLRKVVDSKISADIVYGDAEMVNQDGSSWTKQLPEKLSLEFFFRDTIVHQATFIKGEVFDKFPYDEKLRVASDLKLWMQCMLSEKTFEHLPYRVCNFDMTGVGTVSRHPEEHQTIYDELYPKAIQHNLQELAHYKQVYPQLPRVCDLIEQRRLFKRIATWSAEFMEWIHKVE